MAEYTFQQVDRGVWTVFEGSREVVTTSDHGDAEFITRACELWSLWEFTLGTTWMVSELQKRGVNIDYPLPKTADGLLGAMLDAEATRNKEKSNG